jgi:hypothetical protein
MTGKLIICVNEGGHDSLFSTIYLTLSRMASAAADGRSRKRRANTHSFWQTSIKMCLYLKKYFVIIFATSDAQMAILYRACLHNNWQLKYELQHRKKCAATRKFIVRMFVDMSSSCNFNYFCWSNSPQIYNRRLVWYGMVWYLRGGFPHALKPYMVYCTSPLNFQLSRHTLAVPALCTAYLPKNSGI